jgi:hypothetical protein
MIMETTVESKYARGSKKYKEAVSGNIDRKIANSPKDIPGWGIDADPENDPAYPMKRSNGADHERLNYERPPQQPMTVEILQSIERPAITRVFGTSTPPSGWSGAIKRFAYKFSEADARHWLTLIFSDRVDAIEGIINDLKQGIIPNYFKERGLIAEWKYNRKGAIRNIAVGVAVTSAIVALLVLRNRSKKQRLLS